jgi:hypothetical protein
MVALRVPLRASSGAVQPRGGQRQRLVPKQRVHRRIGTRIVSSGGGGGMSALVAPVPELDTRTYLYVTGVGDRPWCFLPGAEPPG